MGSTGNKTLKLIIEAKNRAHKAFNDVGRQMHSVKGKAGGLNGAFKGMQNSISSLSPQLGKLAASIGPLGLAGVAVLATAAIVGMGAAAVKSFAAFEDAMANVRKTTGFTKEETKELGDAIDQMALSIPVAHDELAKIAAVAGQLGVTGKENILAFTNDVSMMTTAFDMSAEEVAISMAKLGNIYKIPIAQTSNLGSAINVLGNTTAASESQLMAFTMALGPTGQQLGFGATEALAMGASIISLGTDASNAGTRLARAFSMIGQNLDEVASFMGVTTDEFTASFNNMPMETITGVIEKLSHVEGNLQANTIASELFNEIGGKAIKSLTGNIDGLRTNLTNAATGFIENTSLTEEFAAKTDTLKAKFTLVSNATESLKINIGEALAPLAGALAGGAAAGVKGLSAAFDILQKIAGPALDVIFIKFKMMRAFAEGVFGPIQNALSPLKGMLGDTSGAFSALGTVMNIVKDVTSIFINGARILGELLGNLLANAITPLVAKIKEGSDTLKNLYDKLGPLKGLVEGFKDKVGDGVTALSNFADSLKESEPPATVLKESIKELEEAATEMGPALEESVKGIQDYLKDAQGNYKTAISNVVNEIEKLKDAWNLASDEQKVAIEAQIKAHESLERELIEGEKAKLAFFDTTSKATKDATEKQKDFTIEIGKTTVTFSNQAAEVLKNANAYKDLEEKAAMLLELDWEVFTTLETALPNIDVGIGSMASAFVGLEGILEKNIDNLEAVKQSVKGIAEMAGPFLEAGFLDGIKAIGSFAGALKDAGSAINTFGTLQDISVEGCVDFSMHVHNMVAALEILGSQMEDMGPLFGSLNSLIGDLTEKFVYSGDKIRDFTTGFSKEIGDVTSGFNDFSIGISDSIDPLEEFYRKSKEITEIFEEVSGELGTLSSAQKKEFKRRVGPTLVETVQESIGNIDFIEADINRINTIINDMVEATEITFLRGIYPLQDVTEEVLDRASAIKILDEAINDASRDNKVLETSLGTFNLESLDGDITSTVSNLQKWIHSNYGVKVSTEKLFDVMASPPEEQTKWFEEMLHTGEAVTFQWNKQTEAIEANGEKLKQLTNAMQPQLEFMRTLNELAALSTLSTADLNTGLDAITNTLTNLGNALKTFDLSAAMKGLFGDEKTTGSAKKFTDEMFAAQSDLAILIRYIDNLSAAITSLVNSFEALKDVNKSVMADENALAVLFQDITDIMTNFDKAMTTSGFGEKLVKGFDGLLKSGAPLIDYFTKNDLAVTQFNSSILKFKTTITNLVSVMDSLQKINKLVLPGVNELAASFDKARDFVKEFNDALLMHVGAREGQWDMEKYYSSIFSTIKKFSGDWSALTKDMGNSFETFGKGVETITGIISTVIGLSEAFVSLKDIVIVSSIEMEASLSKVPEMIKEMETLLGSDMWTGIITNAKAFSDKWVEVNGNVLETIKSFSAFVSVISSIISNSTRLTAALTDIGDISVISSDKMKEAFGAIPDMLTQITTYIGTKEFKLIRDGLAELSKEYLVHKKILDEVMPTFESVSGMLSTLVGGVLLLSDAFETLNEKTFTTSIDMSRSMEKVEAFIMHFTEALKLNLDGLVKTLVNLDTTWSVHAKTMEKVMPSFKSATGDITTLIGSITSLYNALESLSEMGTVSSTAFDKGFSALIESVSNFAVSMARNVDPLISALSDLRKVWIANEQVLVPLMLDFRMIMQSFIMIAANANNMAVAFQTLRKNSGGLKEGFKTLIDFIKIIVEQTKEFYTPEAARQIAQYVIDVGIVVQAFRILSSELSKATSGIEKKITESVSNVSSTIQSLRTLIPNMFVFGSALMSSFISGINAWKGVLTATMASIANIIKAYLGVSSPTELGALKDLESWPRNLVKSFSEGIKSEMGTLNNSFGGMAVPIATSGGGGNHTSIVFNVSQRISDKATADYATNELKKLLQHQVL